MQEFYFLIEVVIGGLMAGMLYSLVALGFVLIFKASGVFNFAQGAMVLFAALPVVRLIEWGVPAWAAIAIAAAIMVGLAFVIERTVLRPLVNQDGIILFMATLGITFLLEGLAQQIWGSEVYRLDIGIPTDPLFLGEVLVNSFDISVAVAAGLLVAGLVAFFQATKVGRALRAVADDHQAAQSVGIPLNHIWIIVWSIAGLVALAAGIVWGSKLGVQFAMTFVALKALPVLILGGFTSIPGAVIGGLIIGAGEKLSEVYLGPIIGGGIENWFAYMLALVVLFFRPQGLFGERIIERV